MTPVNLLDLIHRTPGDGLREESATSTIIHAVLDDEALRSQWRAVRRAPPDWLVEVVITQIGTDADLGEDDIPKPNAAFRITLRKLKEPHELRLLAIPSGNDWYAGLGDIEHVRVAAMATDASFTTYRARVARWTEDPPLAFAPSEALPDPRKFTNDFTQRNLVVDDVRPWLLATAPQRADPMFTEWRRVAGPRLLSVLADQISYERELVFYFSGPPAAKITTSELDLTALFDCVTEAARWVFVEGARDAETRHLLLANEFARTHTRGAASFGANVLVSARSAYSAYVKAGSKETLKAIAELRKGVVEEGQKISQRAQDLAGALWKDLAVAAAPFVLKILADSAKIANGAVAGGMAIVAALFLVYSFFMQVSINSRFFDRQSEGRKIWQGSLSTVLTLEEIHDYSEVPIALSVADYRVARMRVGIFYAALLLVLCIFAGTNLASSSTVPAGVKADNQVSFTGPASTANVAGSSNLQGPLGNVTAPSSPVTAPVTRAAPNKP